MGRMSDVYDSESLADAIARRQVRERGVRRRILLISLAGAIAVHGVVLGLVIPNIYRFVYATMGTPPPKGYRAPTTVPYVRPEWLADGVSLQAGSMEMAPDFSEHPIDGWPQLELPAEWTLNESFHIPRFTFPIGILPPPPRRDITERPMNEKPQ